MLGHATTKELLEELLIRGEEAPLEFISYRATMRGFARGMLTAEPKLLAMKRKEAQDEEPGPQPS